MIHEFYAVTATSVYWVKDKRDEDSKNAVATKVALKGQSEISVGSEFYGPIIGITDRLRSVVFPNLPGVSGRKGSSSAIVALFLTKEEAMKCFEEENHQPCDSRWLRQTLQVLGIIGDDHVKFYVSKSAGPRLSIFS